jgi:hypothetical protein
MSAYNFSHPERYYQALGLLRFCLNRKHEGCWTAKLGRMDYRRIPSIVLDNDEPKRDIDSSVQLISFGKNKTQTHVSKSASSISEQQKSRVKTTRISLQPKSTLQHHDRTNKKKIVPDHHLWLPEYAGLSTDDRLRMDVYWENRKRMKPGSCAPWENTDTKRRIAQEELAKNASSHVESETTRRMRTHPLYAQLVLLRGLQESSRLSSFSLNHPKGNEKAIGDATDTSSAANMPSGGGQTDAHVLVLGGSRTARGRIRQVVRAKQAENSSSRPASNLVAPGQGKQKQLKQHQGQSDPARLNQALTVLDRICHDLHGWCAILYAGHMNVQKGVKRSAVYQSSYLIQPGLIQTARDILLDLASLHDWQSSFGSIQTILLEPCVWANHIWWLCAVLPEVFSKPVAHDPVFWLIKLARDIDPVVAKVRHHQRDNYVAQHSGRMGIQHRTAGKNGPASRKRCESESANTSNYNVAQNQLNILRQSRLLLLSEKGQAVRERINASDREKGLYWIHYIDSWLDALLETGSGQSITQRARESIAIARAKSSDEEGNNTLQEHESNLFAWCSALCHFIDSVDRSMSVDNMEAGKAGADAATHQYWQIVFITAMSHLLEQPQWGQGCCVLPSVWLQHID